MALSRRSSLKGRFANPRKREDLKRDRSWVQALIFNALLVILPVMAGHVVTSAFAVQGFGDTPTGDAIRETRTGIDRAFTDMVALSGDPDQDWADAVDRQLRIGNIQAARGFLLAAPYMVSAERRASVLEAAREETSGSEDERLARAALIFLPDATRARYELAMRPAVRQVEPVQSEDEEGEPSEEEGETAEPGTNISEGETEPELTPPAVSEAELTRRASFDLIGDSEDLANRSMRWLRGEPTDLMILRLRGFAQIAAESVERAEGSSAPFDAADLALGVSVINAAQRAGRLTPDFVRHLNGRLNAALPVDKLEEGLEGLVGEVLTSSVRAQRVRAIYLAAARPTGVRNLALELELVSRIAERTSPGAALDLITTVRSEDDLRRLRVVVEAGGDRVVALATRMPDRIVELATTGVRWNQRLILQVMGLAAIGMALIWAMLSTLSKALRSDSGSRRL